MTKTWKEAERRVASFFGGVRNWLSGSSGGGDIAIEVPEGKVPHPHFYIEVKHFSENLQGSVWSLMEKTNQIAKKEKKIPILVLHKKNSKKHLLCIYMEDI